MDKIIEFQKTIDKMIEERKKSNKKDYLDYIAEYMEKYEKYLELGGKPKSLEKKVDEVNDLYEGA